MARPSVARAAALFAGLYALFFVLLAIDVAFRIVILRAGFDSALDFLTPVIGELVRAVVGLGVIVFGLRLAMAGRRAGTRALGFLLLFLDVWYLKSFAGDFPGVVQARLANALTAVDTPRRAMAFVFGDPIWAFWLALAAFLWFAVTFPRPVSAAEVEAAGAVDRRGAMRSVALAGADVGAAFRRAVSRLIERGVLRPELIWPVCAVAGVVHALGSAVQPIEFAAWLLASVGVGIGITTLRAGWAAGERSDREALRWLRRGLVIAALAGLAFALLSLVRVAEPAAYLVFLAAPAAVGTCLAVAAQLAVRAEITDPHTVTAAASAGREQG